MIRYGRRKTLIIQAYIGIVGIGITLISNFTSFYPLIIGRLLYGLATGILAIATPRLMEETVPPKYFGTYAGLYCLSFAIATITADLLASLLPPDDDTAALKETNMTLIMLGLPILLYLI